MVNEKSNNISVMDGATNRVIMKVTVGKSPVSIGVNPTTNLIYVANLESDTISVIDGATNRVTTTVMVYPALKSKP